MNSVKDAISQATNDPILKQAQYCGWAPVGHNLACVSNHKNIYVTQDLGEFLPCMAFKSRIRNRHYVIISETWNQVTDDGGYCMKSHRILGLG